MPVDAGAIGRVLGNSVCTVVKCGNLLLQMRGGCMGGALYQDDKWGETG